jgi:predicted dehydrogenase
MRMNELNVAVIGTNIGCTLHIRALRASGFNVSTLVGQNPEKTAYRASHFGIPNALTSFDAALDSDVDAIVIATPPETHHDFTMRAVAAGKHVICEKAFALDVGHAREMRDAAVEAGVVNMISHEWRWSTQNALTRRLIRDGSIGAPIQVVAQFDHTLCAPASLDLPNWWMTREGGGGWLRNYNAHGIDLIRYMVGEFAAVAGTVHPGSDRGMTSDDSYAFAFFLDNDVQGAMTGTCRAWDAFSTTRVIGADAGVSIGWTPDVTVNDANGQRMVSAPADLLVELRGGGPEISVPEETLPQMDDTPYVQAHSSDYGFMEMVGLTSAFATWIRDPAYRNPAIATFDDGLAHVRVIDAVERSRAERRWIDLV